MDGTIRIAGVVVSLFVFTACGAGGANTAFLPVQEVPSRPTEPTLPGEETVDTSEAIGFYSNGSLLDGEQLPDESFAHLKIFRPRQRAWGTRTLINTIIDAAASFRKKFPYGDRVQIGDMSASEGGVLARHASHQNGLDADVAYLKANHLERNPDVWGNSGFEEVFVTNGKITKNFDAARNWFLLKEVVLKKNIGRIFVDPEIKKAFCEKNKVIDSRASLAVRTEVLRRLRPYPNHDDHFHMRIDCPKRGGRCLAQEEPPVGSGCSAIEMASFDEHEL